MSERNVRESLEAWGLKRALNWLDKNPEENIPKLLAWVVKLDGQFHKPQPGDKQPFKVTREALSDPDSNWFKLVASLWTDIDDGVRKTLFENFVVNATIVGGKRQEQVRREEGCNVPWAILMDPTSACNLQCVGCWAAEYGHKNNLSLAEWDSIIQQGKKMGTFMYIYSGGEPMVRKDDILTMCEKHSDCVFLAFTNGTLIDEAFARQMLRVKNFVPAISVEGFEEATDSRRGKGTYDKVVKAMALLQRMKLPFGASCCYTSQNAEVIGSEAYIDDLIDKGCKFAWFFTYMPVGADAVPELIASAEQREYMYRQIRAFRASKPLFTMDFWNDGEYVDGCIAGGRCYLHINAAGDIEPCAFIHYSDSNIREKSLLEAYKSPLFMAYRQGQPFNDNMLRPCPLLDNPERLRQMVGETGARSTDMLRPEDVRELCAKCESAAKHWAPVAQRLWRESHESADCGGD